MLSQLQRPYAYLITDGRSTDEDFADAFRYITSLVEVAVGEGITFIQIREKKLSGKNFFALAAAASAITQGTSTKLLINDRLDIAIGSRADGVHLTESSIPVGVIREQVGKDLLIASSVHSVQGAIDAASGGADFVVYGPVFETPGKGPAVGVDRLAEVCSTVAPFPVIGLGGIEAANCRSVIESGAVGVAAIRGLSSQDLIRSMLNELR